MAKTRAEKANELKTEVNISTQQCWISRFCWI